MSICKNKGFPVFNLGNGNGFFVLEVIRSCEHTTGSSVFCDIDERREGDPASLVADSFKAGGIIGVEGAIWFSRYNCFCSI